MAVPKSTNIHGTIVPSIFARTMFAGALDMRILTLKVAFYKQNVHQKRGISCTMFGLLLLGPVYIRR